MKRMQMLMPALIVSATMLAADVKTNGNIVTIRPDGGQAKVIQLEVINDNIIRVRATSKDELPVKQQSLMIVPQATYKGEVKVTEVPAKESGDPKLVLYVELAFTLPDYRAISKKMRVTQAEVKEMEERLIALLQA